MKASDILKIEQKLKKSGLLLRQTALFGPLYEKINKEVDLEIKNKCREINRKKKALQ